MTPVFTYRLGSAGCRKYIGVVMIKPGELYHCKIVGGGHGGEYLAEIVGPNPKNRMEFADIGCVVPDSRTVFFYCIAASFSDYQTILLRSTVKDFERKIIKKITPEEFPLFVSWKCTKR
jgi:hypothetical protein